MNRALWTVSLSVLVSFCAVAMDTSKRKPECRVILGYPAKMYGISTEKMEDEYIKANNEHLRLQFKFSIEREEFARKEKESRHQEKRLPARETPIRDKIQLDTFIRNGMFKASVKCIKHNKALMYYPPAREIVDANDQINGVRDGRIKGGFYVQLPNPKLLPEFARETLKAAYEADNDDFITAYHSAKSNSEIGGKKSLSM